MPVGDLESMALGLKKYLDDPDASRRIGENARRWVLGNATWKIRASQVLDLVEEVR